MSKKEIAKIEQEAKAIAEYVPEADGAWGGEDLSNDAIRIPRILLMQGQSDKVKEDKASQGDLVNSITGEVLCSKKDSLSLVPIYLFHDWQITEERGGKFEFMAVEPYTPENANRPREDVVGGIKYQNNLGINILCMLEKDLSEDTALPYIITFRRTNMNCGKDINMNAVKKAAIKNKPACLYTVAIGTELKKKDNNSWFINKLVGVKPTVNFEKHVPMLKKWYDTFKRGANVVIDSELEEVKSMVDEASETELTEFNGQF